jgi:hypothetical protein
MANHCALNSVIVPHSVRCIFSTMVNHCALTGLPNINNNYHVSAAIHLCSETDEAMETAGVTKIHIYRAMREELRLQPYRDTK